MTMQDSANSCLTAEQLLQSAASPASVTGQDNKKTHWTLSRPKTVIGETGGQEQDKSESKHLWDLDKFEKIERSLRNISAVAPTVNLLI